MQISPVIIVKDAEHTISQTLESLKQFEEVVIYDTGSTDTSMEIARKFKNVRLYQGEFIGFGRSKNKAAEFAKNDWILSIDADEVISPLLMDSINKLKPNELAVYKFKRDNYYRNKKIKFSGWGNEFVIRVYNKTKLGFNEKLVHEHIEPDGAKIITLCGELRHFSYHSISNFVTKRDLYSELFAVENIGRRKTSPFMAFIRGTFDFLNTFIIKQGIFDGYRGLLISVSNANVTFYKYLKLYEANVFSEKRISLIVSNKNGVLIHTLNSIICQTVPPDEIIIIDDGFQEESRELIGTFSENCFIPISFFRNDKIDDPIILYQGAILKSKYEYLICINGDTVLHKNYIHDHISNAKKGSFVTSRNLVIDYKLASKLYGKVNKPLPNLIVPNYRKSFRPIFLNVSFFKRKRPFSCIGHSGCSFYKDDYKYSNNTQQVSSVSVDGTIVERLKNIGLKRKNLRFSGIQYRIREKSNNEDIDQKRKVLVCLDRLKFLNCGLGQVAVNFGRELLDVKTNAFEFNFLLPPKGFVEFENKVGHTKLNLFRNFFPNYMKSYDLCHVTHQSPSFSFGKTRKNILTIHDLNFVYTKSKFKNRKYLGSLQKNIHKSDAIVFISEFTKQAAYEYLNIPDDKIIRVIYNGVRPPEEYKDRPTWLPPDKQFVFSIGQFLKKKNFHVLLPFVKFLPDDYIIVIAGENNTNYGNKMKQIVADLELQDRVIFPSGISEEHKSFLYNNCEAFLFPSIAEGFGLPIIEAMLCSKPVFCSDRTSLREIGGEFAFFWKSFEPNKMLEVFNNGIETFKENNYKEKQKEYANTYTYERNVSEYLKLYEELLQ